MTEKIYKTMKEIGAEIGMTSHKVGKRLKELGFRTGDGKPSKLAFASNMVEQKWTEDRQNYLWTRDVAKTTKALKDDQPK